MADLLAKIACMTRFVSGTIDRARMGTFERVLWRVLRGNLYMNYAEYVMTESAGFRT